MNRKAMLLLVPAALALAAASRAATFDSQTISGLDARNIGSAAMSGRISAVTGVHEGTRTTLYVGSASGGVWKSENDGTTFKPIFDDEPVQSIGAIAIDPRDPKTIWVGTGEAWTRNSTSVGDGVYKSTDGGETWTNMGLPESERIGRIEIDPVHPSVVYVAALGKLWSDSDDRGLYKTTDGGKTWTKILKGSNPSTGCSTVAMDPHQPQTIYAGLWDFRRQGWTFRSGGNGPNVPSGSGLYKTTDGGATWRELDERSAPGLPPKPWGRTAVAVAPSKPNVVYALVEAVPPRNGLYRSEDGGHTWTAVDRSQYMVWRPFYFANLIVDPKDENKLYKPDLNLIGSNDGGRSFSVIGSGMHGDVHDVWVDPENTDHLVAGDDGGLFYSRDGGNHWWKAQNLPVSQFYHVSLDMDTPYHVYGGLQDNSSWVGDSQYPGGISNSRWENMYGGDGFWMFADPTDPEYLYAESQGGDIGRVNRRTHETRSLKPLPGYKEGKLRFNWNTPIHLSPTRKGTVYLGGQVLFRSRDHGQTWQRISPDLTTNDPAKQQQELSGGVTVDNSYAEMHTTIYAICESPKNANVIWVGTDDGNIQVTRDGGQHWTNVAPNLTGVPRATWVSSVEASHFDEGTAYVTLDAHTAGDLRPYVYRTTDFGKTWAPLLGASTPVRGYAHVVKEDLVRRDLLFLGTEFGLWISIDGGVQWAQYRGSHMPNVAVRDLAIHPRDKDLVIATHGRGIWILDDLTPLRALTPATLDQDVAFLAQRPTVQPMQANGGWVTGDAEFTGDNPTDDAVITYYQAKRHIFGDMTLEVFDHDGQRLGQLPSTMRRGLSRATWSMRLKPPRVPTAASIAYGVSQGPRLLPGTYTVKLTRDQKVVTTALTVAPDPRSKATAAERRQQFDLSMKLYRMLSDMTFLVDRLNSARRALDQRATALASDDPLARSLHESSERLDALRRRIVATKEGGMITGEERLRENLAELYGNVLGYDGRPTQTEMDRADAIGRELADVSSEFDAWAGTQLAAVNAALSTRQQQPLKLITRAEWDKQADRM